MDDESQDDVSVASLLGTNWAPLGMEIILSRPVTRQSEEASVYEHGSKKTPTWKDHHRMMVQEINLLREKEKRKVGTMTPQVVPM